MHQSITGICGENDDEKLSVQNCKKENIKKITDSSCINLTNEHFLDFGISDLKVAMPKKAEKKLRS